MLGWRFREFLGLGILAAAALVVALPSQAQAGARARVSAAFDLRGANGFSIDVLGEGGAVTVVASERRPPIPTFSAGGAPRPARNANGAASIYRARAAGADPTRLDARLGRLGHIAVAFHPSGAERVTRLGPGAGLSCGRPLRIVRRLGVFVGTIEFHGEDGYTSVRATRARGSVGTPLPRACAGAASARRGALLRAADGRSGTSFEARTTAAGVAFLAIWRQRLGGGLVVSRRAYAGAPLDAFRFHPDLTAARVEPPAPFSGAATYRAGAAAGEPSWSGSLTATFPGAAVPMTGGRFRATLGELR